MIAERLGTQEHDSWRQNPQDYHLFLQMLGREILQNKKVVAGFPLDQLRAITSLADFADRAECKNAALLIYEGIHRTDILPYVMMHHGMELAVRCFVSLSLFPEALEARMKRRGAPSPDFYRHCGKDVLSKEGFPRISLHFEMWEEYLQRNLRP
jgi:hypothetical protein